MAETVRSVIGGLLSGGAAVVFASLFVLARARIGPPWLLVSLAGIGVIAVLALVAVRYSWRARFDGCLQAPERHTL